MVLFNYSTRELTAKIVYYGPGLCGKTTNLQYIHENLSDSVRGKMLSLATKTDRTLFFDFLPMDLGEIRGMKTKMQLYTVPGQVFYNETRKLVLKGVDGIVFVADSQQEMVNPNVESFKNLEENLKTHGMSLAEIPHVIQFNKRDLPKLATIEELNNTVNKYNAPFYESVATTGIGVQDTLKAITKLVLLNLTKKYQPRPGAAESPTPPQTQPQQPAAAAGPSVTAEAPQAPEVAPPPAAEPTPAPAETAVPLVAEPMPSAPESIPLSPVAPTAHSAPDAPGALDSLSVAPPTSVASAAPPVFAADQIDDLMDEVGESAEQGLPEVALETPLTESPALDLTSSSPETAPEDPEPGDPLVKLTEVVNDHELFDDPSLDVTELDLGQTREIVIPVQLIREGTATARYKLSLTLRLDPVD